MNEWPAVLTVEQTADYLQVSRETVYRKVNSGAIPARKVGAQWRINKAALDDWLRGEAVPPAHEPLHDTVTH